MTIAVLVDTIVGLSGYQESFWKGVSDAAAELGVEIRTFVGGGIGTTSIDPFEKTRNIIYDIFSPESVDGIVFCGGTLTNGSTHEELESFYRRFASLPSISVGAAGSHIPRILVDNDQGMRDIVQHLIDEHGYQHIAFISGPAGNMDADRRKQIFLDVMRDNGLEVDPDLIYEGDFNNDSGGDAVNHWFGKLNRSPEAIVASNDNMAFGAVNALGERGISIPYTVAVTGFDDVSDAVMTLPPLTTVRQPVYQEAKQALSALVHSIRGEPLPTETLVPAVPVIRQSCGCLSATVNCFTEVLSGATDSVERDVYKMVGIQRDDPAAETLNELMAQMSGEDVNERNFLKLLSELLRQDIQSGADISRWYHVVNRFRFAVTGRANLLHRCQAMISDAEQQKIYMKVSREQKQTAMLIEAERELITSFNLDILVTVMKKRFTALGLNGVVLCLFDDGSRPLEAAHVIAAFKNGQDIPFPKESFSPKTIVPDGVDYLSNPVSSTIIEPLYYREDAIGYIVFEHTVSTGKLYESLAEELSSALEGAILIERVTTAEKMLEERNREIEALVRPMIDAITSITEVANEQQESITELEEQNERSIRAAGEMMANTSALSETLKKTGELVSAIDDITEVINVVAINASIEAAHVGREGAGFAVIAGEVRKLAQSTRKNSTEITGFLTDVDSKIAGLAASNKELSDSFSQLRETVQSTVQTLEIISLKMGEMDRGSNDILKVMNR